MVVVPVFVFDRRQIQRRTPESCDYADDKAFFNAPLSQPYLPRTAKDCWWGDIRGLSAANFRLFQNGIEQKIERVTSERWTITVRDNKTYHAQYSITPAAIWSTTDLGGYSGIFYGPGPDILLYELSYVPTVLGSGCHRIDVTVDALDAKVFAPERYCTGETPTDPLNGTPYGDQLASHLMTDKSGQIPLSLQTGFVYTDEKAARIDVALAFPWDRLNHEWYESNWTLRARTGIVGLVSGENGMYSGSFSDLLYPSYWPMFMFGRGDWEREYRLGSGFPADPMLVESLLKKQDPAFLPSRYETQLDLRPGQYDLRVVLSDEKKFGRASARLDIPEYDGKQLALSSVILCKRYRDAHAAAVERAAASFAPQYVPLVSKGVEFTPAGDTTFTKGADPLIAYFEVYEPLLVAHPKTQVEIHIRIVNGATGQVVKDFPTVDAATYIEAGKTAIHIARKIPFDKLAKGQYRLEVQATDSAGRSTPWQSADFTVVNEAKH